MKFRKKPVVIEAFQWTGDNVAALSEWATVADAESRNARGVELNTPYREGVDFILPLAVMKVGDLHTLSIATLEGDMAAAPGDWIICGLKGEFYACKPDIFTASYDAVA